MSYVIGDEYYREGGRYAPEVVVPKRSEAERDDRETPARNHDFDLPYGPEDFAPNPEDRPKS